MSFDHLFADDNATPSPPSPRYGFVDEDAMDDSAADVIFPRSPPGPDIILRPTTPTSFSPPHPITSTPQRPRHCLPIHERPFVLAQLADKARIFDRKYFSYSNGQKSAYSVFIHDMTRDIVGRIFANPRKYDITNVTFPESVSGNQYWSLGYGAGKEKYSILPSSGPLLFHSATPVYIDGRRYETTDEFVVSKSYGHDLITVEMETLKAIAIGTSAKVIQHTSLASQLRCMEGRIAVGNYDMMLGCGRKETEEGLWDCEHISGCNILGIILETIRQHI